MDAEEDPRARPTTSPSTTLRAANSLPMDLDGLAALVREGGAATAKVHSRLDAIEASLSALSTERDAESAAPALAPRPSLSGPAAAGALSYFVAGARRPPPRRRARNPGSFVAELPPRVLLEGLERRRRRGRLEGARAGRGAIELRRRDRVDAGRAPRSEKAGSDLARRLAGQSLRRRRRRRRGDAALREATATGAQPPAPRSKAVWSNRAAKIAFNQSEPRFPHAGAHRRPPAARAARRPPALPDRPTAPTHRTPTSRTCSPGSGRTISDDRAPRAFSPRRSGMEPPRAADGDDAARAVLAAMSGPVVVNVVVVPLDIGFTRSRASGSTRPFL